MTTTLERPAGAGFSVVGQPVPRVDSVDKVTGRAKYTADLNLPGTCCGVFLRSPHAHARVLKIDTSEAETVPGVAAIITKASIRSDQQLVVEEEMHAARRVLGLFVGEGEKVKYQGQKIAAVAAISRHTAEEAAGKIKVEYEELPAVIDVRRAVKPETVRIHEETELVDGPAGTPWERQKLNNVAGQNHREEGDVEAGFRDADQVFEDTYVIPRAHQTYIEPQVAVADVAADGKITVWTSTQGHFAVRSNLANSLRIPISKINVVGMTVGGGFGAKFGGVVDTYAVLLAQKARRPVKIVYTREEEFLDAKPAPGAVITVKTGVKKDGTITARQAWALWDVGVGSGGCGSTNRIRGVYIVPNFKVDAYDVNTCKPAPGAYRAPGAPQASFASEAQLNRIADELGIDPVELRLKNMREGEQVDFKATLRAVADAAGWWQRTKGPHEGWGVAIGEWTNGAGPGSAVVSLHEDGSARVFSGLMDLTGTDTAMAQIAAEVLKIPYEKANVVRGDTDSAPFATASGGSVVTFSMGNAVKRAAEDAKRRVLEQAAEHLEVAVEDLELADEKIQVRGHADTSVTLAQIAQMAYRSRGGPIVGRGSFASEPSATTTAAQICNIRVDPETGHVTLVGIWNSLDCGKAINPMAVEGQMEGGVVQGFAWGLLEAMRYGPDGHNLNPGFVDYRVPTSLDFPDIESILIEVPTKNGPFGVKGVGEPPIAPGIAAVQCAVHDAVGLWINEAPFTPETIYWAMRQQRGESAPAAAG